MSLQFGTTSQAVADHAVKVLVYAGPGMGKTSLCATAPKPIILSAESGLLSLSRQNIERMFGVNTPGVTYDIPFIQIRTVEDLMQAFSLVANDPNCAQFKTICIDSITEIGETLLANAKKTVKDPRQAYGELLEKMIMTVKAFRDLPGRHIYVAAKMEPSKDEVTGLTTYGPAMPGQKLGPQLPYLFDEVFRLGINKDGQGNPYRFFQTGPDLQYTAKDRSGVLSPVEPPNLSYIFTKITGVSQ